MDLALNNLQRLICHKTHQTKPNQIKIIFKQIYMTHTSVINSSQFVTWSWDNKQVLNSDES